MPRLATGLILLAFAGRLCAAPAVVDPMQALLEQARLWQSLDRPLEAQQALDKAARLKPASAREGAEALTLQAMVQLQQHRDPEVARTLVLLRQRYPGYPGIARVEQLRRVMGPDRNKLLIARSLFNAGKYTAAYAAFTALYQGPPPDGALTLEYWQLVARLPGGWARAQAALRRLVDDSPANHQNRLALTSLYLQRPPVPESVLAELKTLSQFDDSRSDALGQWRRALLQVDGEIPLDAYTSYLKVAPDDTQISDKLAALTARRDKQRALLADPAWRALLAASRALDDNRLAVADDKLKLAASRYGRQPEYLLALGRLREKQGRFAEAADAYRRGQALESDNPDWTRRVVAARQSGLIASADTAMRAARWREAGLLLDEAERLGPGQVPVLLARAQWYARQGQNDPAKRLYHRVLRQAPDSGEALAGLVDLYLSAGKPEEALRFLHGLPVSQRRALGRAYPAALAQVEREQGDRLVDAGRLDEALPHLRNAVEAQPDNAWHRFALANALLASGQRNAGRAVLERLAAAPRADVDSLYAYSLFLARIDDSRAALETLERVPANARNDGMRALQHRVWRNETLRLADARIARGDFAHARQGLAEAEAQAGDDPDLLAGIADGWVRAGDAPHARRLLEDLNRRHPTPAGRLALASLLLDLQDPASATALLAQLQSDPLDADQKQALAELRARHAVALADLADARGDAAAGETILLDALRQSPDNTRLLRNLAARDNRAAHFALAQARLLQVLARDPADDEASLLLADAEAGAGQHDAAVARLERLLIAPPLRSIDFRLRVLARLNDMGEGARVDRELDRMWSGGERQPGVAGLKAQRAVASGQPDAALAWLRRGLAPATPQAVAVEMAPIERQALLPVAPEPAGQERMHETYAELLDARSLTVWQGLDLTYRSPYSGTPGQSQTTMWQWPLLVEMPAPGHGTFFLRSDGVSMKAGSLDPGDSYNRARFGAVAACADQAACAADAGAQHASGRSLGIGYRDESWRVDVGTTPRDFPVAYTIGGVRYDGSIGLLNYNVDVSRRPITSSLLSYAGTRDPYTGEIWGGVRASGASFGLGYDQGGSYGVWSKFGAHELTGVNVADNRRLTAMAGIYWRLLKAPTEQITVGLNSINFWYQKNLGAYTFGQGGYYSPQRYNSLSVPLSYAARSERLSYVLRASASISSASERDSPYFPTRPDLQTLAGNPVIGGSAGPGWGAALTGAMEYQLTPKLAIGAQLGVQYSQFYQPAGALMYLRWQPDATARTLPFPVEPLEPYSSL
jgi:cellulose synthase operon protein C